MAGLGAHAREHGLVPIRLAFLDKGHRGRPWDEGELNDRCDLASVDQLDASAVLAKSWVESLPDSAEWDAEWDEDLAEMIAPFGQRCPGLKVMRAVLPGLIGTVSFHGAA